MDVIEKAKKGWQHWQLFKEIKPGHRFQTRYNNHRQRRERGETSTYARVFNLACGPALIVAGIAFLPTPGPSYIIIVIGMWMLAGEFLPLARFFDRLEVRLRRLGRGIKGLWTGLPAVVKVLAALTFVVAVGYVAYYLFFG
jgi:Flp pilus assembly protein TadB